MKYYTGRGDDGETDKASGRIKKDDKIIELVGSLDELNAFLGYAISKSEYDDVKNALRDIEKRIYKISAIVTGYSEKIKNREISIKNEDIKELERKIDAFSVETPDLIKFIYPNGSEAACTINICRTLARKAERKAVMCEVKDSNVLSYLNRVSSLLFVLFRVMNKRNGYTEEKFD